MSSHDLFSGTAAWLRGQWSNPGDVFTILLIIGGDIVRVAIAQLCAGPLPYLVPVSFSFGWVTYAVSAMLSAVGDNRLMPKPEVDCLLINANSGFSRTNKSWILSRMLRDFDFWRPGSCDEVKEAKLMKLRRENDTLRQQLAQERLKACDAGEISKLEKNLEKLPKPEEVRIGLRVTVWNCVLSSSDGSGDVLYWIGLLVSAVQLGLAAVPWGLYDEWYTFFVTGAGTLLAYASAALPQWVEEKSTVRRLRTAKGVFLTEGNGADDAILILCRKGDLDLEALAAPQRELRSPKLTRTLSIVLATLWIAFLVTVAGWEQHTWYLVGVGIIGILHNVTVAGMKRQPKAWGLDLQYIQTMVAGKVMEVLLLVEEAHPRAGWSLLPTFFPGELFPREKRLWQYAERRYESWARNGRPVNTNGAAIAWAIPPLIRPSDRTDDDDIPNEQDKAYDDHLQGANTAHNAKDGNAVLGAQGTVGDAVITITGSK